MAPEITLQVSASADDGFIDSSTGFSNNATIVSVGNIADATRSLFVRFLNVTIPQGATINSAKIQYMSSFAQIVTPCVTKIYFNDEDNATAPTTVETYTGKSITTAYVDWTIPAWDLDTWYDSPDISAVVQEVVDRASWASGNAMMLLHKNNGSDDNARRGPYSYRQTGNVSGVKLVINYTPTVYTKTLTTSVSASATVTNTLIVNPETHIVFCDESFAPISSPIDNFESLIWTQRHYISGSFSLVLPTKYYPQVMDATFVYNSDMENYMIIEDITVERAVITVSGSSLEEMLEWRNVLMWSPYSATAREAIARSVVTTYCTGTSIATMVFKNTPITTITNHSLTPSTTTYIPMGKTVAEFIRYLYAPVGWGYTLTRSSTTANLTWETKVGEDRTSGQSVNKRIIFSTTAEDILKYTYNINVKDFRNACFGTSKTGYDPTTGLTTGYGSRLLDNTSGTDERRYITQHAPNDSTSSEFDILNAAELLKYPIYESLTAEISPKSTIIIGTDYFLGDYVDVVITELGISMAAQVTEVDYVYEKGTKIVIPTFGAAKITPRQFIRREANGKV